MATFYNSLIINLHNLYVSLALSLRNLYFLLCNGDKVNKVKENQVQGGNWMQSFVIAGKAKTVFHLIEMKAKQEAKKQHNSCKKK